MTISVILFVSRDQEAILQQVQSEGMEEQVRAVRKPREPNWALLSTMVWGPVLPLSRQVMNAYNFSPNTRFKVFLGLVGAGDSLAQALLLNSRSLALVINPADPFMFSQRSLMDLL